MHETSPMPKDIPHVPQLELLCANTNMLTALTAPVEVYLLLYVLSPPLVVLVLLMRPRQKRNQRTNICKEIIFFCLTHYLYLQP
jgi:hypothetical protein